MSAPIIAASCRSRSTLLFKADFTGETSSSLSDLQTKYVLQIDRASNGHSVQTDTNTMVSSGYLNSSNTPRFGRRLTSDPVGLVLEESRTNQILFSRDGTNVTWTQATPASITITRPYATGPDGDTTHNWRAQVSGTGNLIKQTPSHANSKVIGSCWVRAPTVGTKYNINLSGSGASGTGSAGDTLWHRLISGVITTTGANFNHNYTGLSSPLNGSQDSVFDWSSYELGSFATEAIESTGSAATRAGERLYHPSSGSMISKSRASISIDFQPKGDLSGYSAVMRVWSIDSNNYVEINPATGVVTCVTGGSSYSTGVGLFWNAFDTIQLFVACGGGASPTTVQYTRNGGSSTVLSTGSPSTQPNINGTGAMDLLCSGTTKQLSAWVRKIQAFTAGNHPDWTV